MQDQSEIRGARHLTYSISELGNDSAKHEAWQAYASRAKSATIYHDLAWREVFGRALGYTSHMLMAMDEAGNVGGILPLYRVPSLLGRPRLVAVPFRDRGGPAFENTDALRALLAAAKSLQVSQNATGVILKAIRPLPDDVAAALVRADYWVHSEIDLESLDQPALRRALGDKTRNMIRQAEKSGQHVADVDGTPHLDQWMDIYRQSQHGLGLPAFPRAFFDGMFRLLGPRGLARLFLVSDAEGQTGAASIILLEENRAIYGYSASTRSGRDSRANDLMLYHLLNWSLERGLKWFDMGSDSPLQDGLLFFKRKWLARQTAIPTYYLGKPPDSRNDSSERRFDVARRLIRRMPAPLVRLGLDPVLRYLG